MDNKKRYRPYEEKYINFSNFFEKVILRLLIIFVIALIISQTLLTIDGLREIFVPVDSFEGAFSFVKS